MGVGATSVYHAKRVKEPNPALFRKLEAGEACVVNGQPVTKQDSERMTRAEYARHRGVSRAAVTKAISTGRIHVVDGLIDPVAADRAWARNTRPQAPAVATAPPMPRARMADLGQHEALLTDATYLSAADPERVAIIEYDFETGQVLVVVFPGHVLEQLYRRDDAARREFLRAELRRLAVDNRRTAGCEADSGS